MVNKYFYFLKSVKYFSSLKSPVLRWNQIEYLFDNKNLSQRTLGEFCQSVTKISDVICDKNSHFFVFVSLKKVTSYVTNHVTYFCDQQKELFLTANIFKIKKPSPDSINSSGDKSTTDRGQYLKLKSDINTLKKELSIMSSKMRRRKNSVEINQIGSQNYLLYYYQ